MKRFFRITPFSRKKYKNQLAVWGWWQGNNLGDNWIKKSMSEHFKNAVFIDTNTNCFQDFGFVICGGGGLFIRDVIHQWKKDINVPFGVIGLGAEFEHPDTKAIDLLKQSKFFYVRDRHSLLCMHLPISSLSYDVTFLSPLPSLAKSNDNSALFIWRDPDELLKYEDFRKYIGDVRKKQAWLNRLKPYFKNIYESTFHTNKCNIEEITNNISFIVSARYHGIVAAIQRGIPCIGIDLCPKIRSIMKDCGIEEFCLKLNDTDKIESLINDANRHKNEIVSLQCAYTKKAITGVLASVETAKNIISRYIEFNK
jgi:hypothetical protein